MVLSSMCVFLQRSIYPRTAAVSFYVTMVGATPYKLFLRVPWVNKQLASSDFTFRKRQKVAGVKYDEKWSWEYILAPFYSQLLKIEAAMAFWALAWQKTSSVQTCLVF
jgi:hypothetical protein